MFLIALLNLLVGVSNASLPDFTQTINVPNLTFSLCGQGLFATVPFIPPAPEYDTVETNWKTGIQYYMYGTNNDPQEDTFYLGIYNFALQAEFELQQGTAWTSTTVLYHERNALTLQPGIPDGVIKTRRWTYDSISNINGMQFQTNYIKFRCYVGGVNPIQNYTQGSSGWGVQKIGGTMKITWKDLH